MAYPVSLDLVQKNAQNLKQIQRLIMSPQMQQAFNLLQMPLMELSVKIDQELEQNPILEHSQDENDDDQDLKNLEEQNIDDEQNEQKSEQELLFDDQNLKILKQLDDEFKDYFDESENYHAKRTQDEENLKNFAESSIQSKLSLFEFLMKQAQETFENETDRKMAELIIGNLDGFGFLQIPLEEIALSNEFDPERLEEVLFEIQTFEPYGVGARNLKESLLIQLNCQNKKQTLAYKIIDKHYDDLINNRIPAIHKNLRCTLAEIEEAVEKHISKLDLHPGTYLSNSQIQYIVPDATIFEEDNQLKVAINDEGLPHLRINTHYLRMLENENIPLETKDFIKQKILSAKWLMRNIFQRSDTIEKIACSLTKHQRNFFLNPEGKLNPMTMRMVAEELNLHESTIARAVSNKYIQSPRGLLPLRSFFTAGYLDDKGEDVSAATVRDILIELIRSEDKMHPLSDEAISGLIKKKGIPCARRTVAKYRLALNIGNTHQRKKYR